MRFGVDAISARYTDDDSIRTLLRFDAMTIIDQRAFATSTNDRNVEAGLHALRSKLPVLDQQFPVIWHLDVTGRCNLACAYCQRSFFLQSGHEFLKGDLSDEVFDKLVPYFRYAKIVALLSMLGEPLVVKSLPRWWQRILDAGAKPQTTTNGTFLTPELADMFAGSGGRLKISIDSFEQDTLNILRPGHGDAPPMSAALLRDRLQLVERHRKMHSSSSLQLGVNVCLTAKNLPHAVQTMEECLRNARVDVFTLASFRMPRDEADRHPAYADQLSLDPSSPEQREGWRAVVRFAAKARADGVHFVFPYSRAEWQRWLDDDTLALHEDSFESRSGSDDNYYCCVPWLKTGVLSDGTVIPCHLLYWPQPEFTMGNLARESFESIWNGERYVGFRRNMAEGKDLGACAQCKSWWRFYTPQRVD
jgi:radical SAM protein with 4Fe4S-binding SPASM domain